MGLGVIDFIHICFLLLQFVIFTHSYSVLNHLCSNLISKDLEPNFQTIHSCRNV